MEGDIDAGNWDRAFAATELNWSGEFMGFEDIFRDGLTNLSCRCFRSLGSCCGEFLDESFLVGRWGLGDEIEDFS